MKIQTYGKQNIIKRTCLNIKNRFRINEHTERALSKRGIGVYVPKVTKAKLGIGIIGGGLLISPLVPMGFILGIPLLRWGLK